MSQSAREGEGCVALVHEELCVDADVSITPIVEAGPPVTRCLEMLRSGECEHEQPWRRGDCEHRRSGHCCFTVRQTICVTVPLIFGARAEANVAAVSCETPKPGPCPAPPRE